MKKLLYAIMLMLLPATMSAQVRFGVKAGINTVDFAMNDKLFQRENQRGFTLGGVLDIDLPLPWLSLDIGMQYENRQIENSVENNDLKKTIHLLNIPVAVKAGLGMNSVVGVFAFTGPQFSFNLGNDNIWNHTYNMNATQLSWLLGAGVRILKDFQITYNYNIALGNTAEVERSQIYNQVRHSDLKESLHQMHFTYFF